MIGQDKREALKRRMVSLGIREDELIERFIRGTGHGGQKINKTSSCVYLHHPPSGIEINCQAQRSRDMNRFLARRELCDRIEEIEKGRLSSRQQKIEKIRRQKRRRSRRQRQRDVGLKRQHGQKKELRRKPSGEDS